MATSAFHPESDSRSEPRAPMLLIGVRFFAWFAAVLLALSFAFSR